MNEQRSLTVSQVNNFIKDYLDNLPTLRNLYVRGELSNLKIYPGSGHIYCTLKDEESCLKAVMFGGATKLKFRPADGMRVICRGRISVFLRDGVYQLYIDSMEPDGIGSLYIAFEQLKAKLEAEGLFAPEHKKPLPKIPFRIGIITAPTGAAVRDMINVTGRRFPAAKIIIYPSLVQGAEAPAQLIKALKYMDERKLADVIIIGRGGGSIEDLWAFNNESLARAIFACETPVISAVGHEIDFTIADFVADRRAPTPSAAAEIAVPDANELKIKFENVQARLSSLLKRQIENLRRQLKLLADRPVLQNPLASFDDKRMNLARLEEKLYGVFDFPAMRKNVNDLADRLSRIENIILERASQKLKLQSEKLLSLNPLSVLERGYSAAFRLDGTVIKNASDVAAGERFDLRFRDGVVRAQTVDKFEINVNS
ncbi:MAG TPA: exodeoxyribonuclease VII large subunit [Bacillota bacterium]|mgnify:CR=1 FL=1|nr:exodeoxyribonuclease VII large subunit [Bacillota bacterium]HOK68493.1 exodeoxyribonuclease VII large subunit [Bacillota bacterium]HPP85121.1 exodeoxyribonuclease VII large subunit [Bacillota bacterium]